VGKDYADERICTVAFYGSGTAGDIADAALFFASDQSEYITGVLLNVDGGRHVATNTPPAA